MAFLPLIAGRLQGEFVRFLYFLAQACCGFLCRHRSREPVPQGVVSAAWRVLGKEWKRVFADLEVGPGSDLFDQVPRKRRGHAVAVDPEGEKIFIFGGLARDGDMDIYLNDVWSTTLPAPVPRR